MSQTNETSNTVELTLEQLHTIHGGADNQTLGQIVTTLGQLVVDKLVAIGTTVAKIL